MREREGGPGGEVGEDVALFDGEVVAPMGDFDVSFQLLDKRNRRCIFIMYLNFFELCSRFLCIIRSISQYTARLSRISLSVSIRFSVSISLNFSTQPTSTSSKQKSKIVSVNT